MTTPENPNPTPSDIPATTEKTYPTAMATLLNRVVTALSTYVIYPSQEALYANALWIAATHAAPAWNIAPRLVIKAPEKRCGKSRTLDLNEALCHNPLMTVNASPSAVYRAIAAGTDDPPTLLIDEADAIFGPKAGDNEDLRGLLNAGHQRGRPALRYNAGTNNVEKLETFAMAALAGIGSMPDTIEDRAVIIRMRRRAPGQKVAPYRVRRDGVALQSLRDDLHKEVRFHLNTLTAATPDMPLEDRAADTWEALVAIADVAGGPWPQRARHAAVTLNGEKEDATPEANTTRLLADIRSVFDLTDAVALPTKQLLHHLKDDPEAPWSSMGNDGLTAHRLGRMLTEYDIRADVLKIQGVQARGYRREAFTDAWERYLSPGSSPTPNQSVTSVNVSPPQVTAVTGGDTLLPGDTLELSPTQGDGVS